MTENDTYVFMHSVKTLGPHTRTRQPVIVGVLLDATLQTGGGGEPALRH